MSLSGLMTQETSFAWTISAYAALCWAVILTAIIILLHEKYNLLYQQRISSWEKLKDGTVPEAERLLNEPVR